MTDIHEGEIASFHTEKDYVAVEGNNGPIAVVNSSAILLAGSATLQGSRFSVEQMKDSLSLMAHDVNGKVYRLGVIPTYLEQKSREWVSSANEFMSG